MARDELREVLDEAEDGLPVEAAPDFRGIGPDEADDVVAAVGAAQDVAREQLRSEVRTDDQRRRRPRAPSVDLAPPAEDDSRPEPDHGERARRHEELERVDGAWEPRRNEPGRERHEERSEERRVGKEGRSRW